jgi:phosphopantothenoylcysteine decarboxylase / phosphopantothenate---cysteine ligase
VLVPATADLLARMAQGRADDMLTTTLLTARCPVLAVPAMHTEMWEHPATVDNVATLRRRGTVVLEPASGRLTGADSGRGRLPEPPEIAEFARLLLEWGIDDGGMPFPLPRDLEGRRVVVSAGGTAEPLDPVRTLGNRSSGRQGYSLARVAAQRGADVTLVAGTVADLDPPAGVELRRVQTTREMRDAVLDAAKAADVVVMAAAVSDFRPASTSAGKIKKGQDAPSIPLEFNPDILRELVTEDVPRRLVVGFAAETGDEGGSVLDYGRAKLERKGCDLLVVNAVGAGRAFEVEDNEGWLLGADGSSLSLPMASKAALAARVWDAVAERLP